MTKKCLSMLAMLLLVAVCICVLAGCGGEEISQIVVKNSDAPRLTYVVGQELDLEKGVLTVVIDGKENAVPLSAEGVCVTGYDKNTIGEQTLTITYKEKVTHIKVTVVPRMSIEGYENHYFVGSEFDNSKGRLKIVRDNGTTFSVALNDPGVSIKSFDSSVAGQRPVQVSYTDSNGTYETEFLVNVYGVGAVNFTAPTKTAYQSHETELSFAGGYFTVTAEGAPDIKRYVNITADMVTGFDPSAAKMDKNRTEPVKQTVIYSYEGHQFEQEITIIYSGVSVVIERAAQLKHVDWSGDALELTDADKEAILDAATELVALTMANRSLIPEEDVQTVVRLAAYHVMECLMEELDTYSHTIALDDKGYFILVAESYDYTVADYKRLYDPNSKLNLYISILSDIKEAHADVEINHGFTVGNFVAVPTTDDLLSIISLFEFMIELYDQLSVVPEDWTVESLAEHAAVIEGVVRDIKGSHYDTASQAHVYRAVSSWRAKDDYFRIIYAYYLYTAENKKDYVLNELWQSITLPGKLEEWYGYICNANHEAQLMEDNGNKAYLYDTTNFMFFYWKAQELAEEIKNGDDPLCSELYDLINGDYVLNLNVVYANCGYYYHMSAMVDSARVLSLWENYIKLCDLYVQGVEIPDEYFNRVLDDFCSLSTSEVLGFLYSLHFGYSFNANNAQALDCTTSAKSQFTYLIGNYFMSQLSESGRPAFIHMLNAMECYALNGIAEDAEEDFRQTMMELNALYATLPQEDKAAFDGMFGDCYAKYQAIYETLGGKDAPSIGDEEATKLEQLKTLLLNYDELMAYLMNESTSQEEQKTAFVLVFAIYEKARQIYEDILNTGSEAMLTQLYTSNLLIEGTQMSMETTYYFCRNSFASYMFNATAKLPQADGTVANRMVCEVYLSDASGIRAFLADAYAIIWKQFKGEAPSLESAIAAIESFTKLSNTDKVLFYYMGIDYYYDGILVALTKVLPASCDSIALGLLEAELIYVNSTTAKNQAEAPKMFMDRMEPVIEAYEQVPEEDLTARDTYLEQLYRYYKAIYDAMDVPAAA